MNRSKAIFLDRDGVINFEKGDYTCKIKDFIINEGVIEALQHFKSDGYVFIIISNQSGVSKGFYSVADVELLHRYFTDTLNGSNILIKEIYYCPHHPDTGNCLCRKPCGLLFEKAIARFDIDPSISYMIGDKERDITAGESVGIRGILIKPNSSLMDIIPLGRL